MRSPNSHKGENGVVAIIGGSQHQHGAPLFSAFAAEASGVDLLYIWVPECHAEVSKQASLNFQVHTFGSSKSDEISPRDCTRLIEFLATIDAAVIGPGLARTQSSVQSIQLLLEEAPCPLVVDASALQSFTLDAVSGRGAILTPHLGELERMGIAKEELGAEAIKHRCTFLVKAPVDTIVSEDGNSKEVEGGNPGLTVGGTGDALAGIVCGLLAQGRASDDACSTASRVIKAAGDALQKTHGYAYTTRDVIDQIPMILKGA